MKDPKKVEAGKRLAAINCKKREEKKREEQAQFEKTTRRGFTCGVNQYHGIGAVIAVEMTDDLGYDIFRSKKRQVSREVPNGPCRPLFHGILLLSKHHAPRLTSLRWIKSLLYYKNRQE